jgi:septal ring factor EnvC (AmiA/AmiB activator)
MSLKVVCALACAIAACALAQDASPPSPDVAQLSQQLQQTRTDLADSKRQIQELRQSLEELRRQVQSGHPAESAPAVAAEPTVSAADQDVGFLAAKIGELHQDKVESSSKYPVKISGLILFNSYWNKGFLDIQDLPSLALPGFPGRRSQR